MATDVPNLLPEGLKKLVGISGRDHGQGRRETRRDW